jgi:L-ascorbate metabolism protein UlaG (beta-lactamase superfamily)
MRHIVPRSACARLGRVRCARFLVAWLASACSVWTAPAPAPRQIQVAEPTRALDTRSLEVHWIGHATVLLRVGERWILTDPMFSARAGGVLPRKVGAAMTIDALPRLDCVVVSHAHFDHLDAPSLERLAAHTLAVPSGLPTYLPALRVDTVAALEPWQSTDCHGVRITAVPASHGDGRFGLDALWRRHDHAGFVFEHDGSTIYFAGDTGYAPALFREIGRRFAIDVALLPVGPAGRARWIERWRRRVHLTPADALLAFRELRAQWMVPIHWGAFYEEPAAERRAIETALATSPDRDHVRLLTAGDSTEFLW